jgi:ribosomal-protein-alanine N-acetyltransferase
MQVLENAVIRLEPQRAAHAAAMFEVLSDPAIYEHENEPPPSVDWLRTRFSRLENRSSPDGTEHWLNWVIRLPSSVLVGFVQATVYPTHRALIAYELNSRYWGKGLATAAVELMVTELAANYAVETLSAVLKKTNARSRRLLERMGFSLASVALHQAYAVEPDELLMLRDAVIA